MDDILEFLGKFTKFGIAGCALGCLALSACTTAGVMAAVFAQPLVLGLPLVFEINAARGLGDDANAYMLALRNEDYETVFNLLTSDTQARLENAGGLRIELLEYHDRPLDWHFNSFQLENNTGEVGGTFISEDFPDANLRLTLRQGEEGWRVQMMRVNGADWLQPGR